MSILFFPVFQLFPSVRSVLPPLKCCAECVPALWGSGVPLDVWLGGEERASTSTGGGLFPSGMEPGLAGAPHCPHLRAALAPHNPHSPRLLQPHGAPQNTCTPRELPCSSLPALLLSKAGGAPLSLPGLAAPDPLNLQLQGPKWGSSSMSGWPGEGMHP